MRRGPSRNYPVRMHGMHNFPYVKKIREPWCAAAFDSRQITHDNILIDENSFATNISTFIDIFPRFSKIKRTISYRNITHIGCYVMKENDTAIEQMNF